jgi:polyisoprenyl-phosphate glycosyltransferase
MISVVVPIFNEEGNVGLLSEALSKGLAKEGDYEIIFVDDGSRDGTLEQLKLLRTQNPHLQYVSLSRNFGHQQALKAGLDRATGDCIISMDGDMQHPPEFMAAMLAKWREGYDVVYTIRAEDPNLSFSKRLTSRLFYKTINLLSPVEIKPGTADFRLLDRRVADELKQMNDPFLFLRGLIPWMGYRQIGLTYSANKRHSGVTKYTFRKMTRLALAGITSFSTRPLHFSTLIGVTISLLAFAYGLYAIFQYLFSSKVISGWASLLASVLFIGGIQLVMIGVLGEYLGKIYIFIQGRPTYLVRESTINPPYTK